MPNQLLLPDEYAKIYETQGGFERVCTIGRQRRNMAFLNAERPRTVLEVGCGPVLLAAAHGLDRDTIEHWTIVEPAEPFIERAMEVAKRDRRISVVAGYLEDSVAELRVARPEGFDAIVLSGVLHETLEPLRLLASASSLLRPGARMVVSVPNAYSYHRMLAVESGLIDSVFELSQLDSKLGRPVVYDQSSLASLLREVDLHICEFGGIVFKPFTNSQMDILLPLMDQRVIDGLVSMGSKFPEAAAEIYLIAQKP
jgi:SAM-dependent methyltransferase